MTKQASEAKAKQRRELGDTIKRLAQEIAEGNGDEVYDRFLTWMSKLHRYSFGNIALAQWQWSARQAEDPSLPELSYLGSYKALQKVGRQVRKGERGLAIFVPWQLRGRVVEDEETGEQTFQPPRTIFRIGHVFDISQTDGDEVPRFVMDTPAIADALPTLLDLAASDGILVDFTDTGAAEGISLGGRIKIQESSPPGIQAHTLIHELAHEYLHQTGGRRPEEQGLIEGEAEGTAVVVLRALGVDVASNSAAYIRGHGCTAEGIIRSMDRIARTARKILDAFTPEPTPAEEEASEVS